MFGNPMEIAILAGAAVLLFGGNKIRDVARGLGAAKKEFSVGQAEADVAHERAMAEARATAEANAAAVAAAREPHPAGPIVGASSGPIVGAPTVPYEPPAPRA